MTQIEIQGRDEQCLDGLGLPSIEDAEFDPARSKWSEGRWLGLVILAFLALIPTAIAVYLFVMGGE